MTTNVKYVVGLGEALWDILPDGKKLGGAPANFAFHAGQFGLNAIAVSALGEDKLAEETIEQLEAKKLAYCMPRVPYPTGTVQVTLDAGGVPTYDIKENVAWDNIPFNKDIEAIARKTRAVCWGSLAQRNVVSRNTIYSFLDATPKDCMKIFDINLRQNFYTKEAIRASIKRCNVLKINDEELLLMRGMFGIENTSDEEACKWFIEQFDLRYLILTGGATFSTIMSNDGEVSTLATPHVTVADTVGAGDSFSGTFTGRILNGDSLGLAHRAAVNTAAFVCTQEGAWPTYPAEITDYLAEIGK